VSKPTGWIRKNPLRNYDREWQRYFKKMGRISQERLDRLTHLLDDLFRIPGTKWTIGLDSLISLIPGIGDVSISILSAWIIFQASRHNVPRSVLLRMGGNMTIDFVFDVFHLWETSSMPVLRQTGGT
jgi:hypothetical protein